MFDNSCEARQQLLRDKNSLLEGYVTEYLFEMQFLRPRDTKYYSDYTNGWWSAETRERTFFFLAAPSVNAVDHKIIRTLSSQYEVWRVWPENNTWFFHKGTCVLDLNKFIQMYKLMPLRSRSVATAVTRNIDRQRRCADFFESHELLKKVATERNFADDILSVYFNSIVNIDFFALNPSGKICALEIKFKFESRAGTFGINVGQFQMFELLSKHGVEIQHWILYNSTHNKELSIFGFLELPNKKWWRRGLIHTNTAGPKKSAPAETSVQGTRQQGYYEFAESDFPFKAPLKVTI